MIRLARCALTLCVLLALTASLPVSAAQEMDLDAKREEARSAYDRGRCGEVLAAYNQVGMRDANMITGVDNYRIGFCMAFLRRGDAAPYYEAALAELAIVTATEDAPLETYFYQVNALLNLDRKPDAVKAARLAVERWEAGQLVVPEEQPEAWFRLGKIFRDAGNIQGAVEPFSRALAAAEAGGTLRDPYLERIARGASEAGNTDLARRAGALLAKHAGTDAVSRLRLGKALLAAGDLAGAREAFASAGKTPGEAGLPGQYATRVVDRMQELTKWKLDLPQELPDGRSLIELSAAETRDALGNASKAAFKAMAGRSIEVPFRKKAGTRAMPHPDTLAEMRSAQQIFVALTREALVRGYPLREWAVGGGFTTLIYHPWKKLFRQRLRGTRDPEILSTLQPKGE